MQTGKNVRPCLKLKTNIECGQVPTCKFLFDETNQHTWQQLPALNQNSSIKRVAKEVIIETVGNLVKISYLWYLNNVAQRKRLPIFHVFPAVCMKST